MKAARLSLFPLAALSVVASPLAVDVGRRAATITEAELDDLKFFSEYAAAGYCNSEASAGQAITCAADVCPTVEGNNATAVGSFAGLSTDIQGFVATDPARQLVVVSFRGSHSIRNWITDVVFAQVPCDLVPGCLVHAGFATAWAEVEEDVLAQVAAAAAAHPAFAVAVAGHSLGGAVGTLAAAALRAAGHAADVYSYGSPRVGNRPLVDFVTAQAGAEYRVTHLDDPVPRLPPIVANYRHTSPEYWLSGGDATTDDYGVASVKVCDGSANVKCNAGTVGLDTDAHGHYFRDIGGCSPDGTPFKLKARDDISDEELEQRLTRFAEMDMEYAAALDE